MKDRLDELEAEFEDVVRQLSDPEVLADHDKLRTVGRRHRQLEPIAKAVRELRAAEEDLAAARQMLEHADGAERDEMRAEIDSAQARIEETESALKVLLLPVDPNDERDVIV